MLLLLPQPHVEVHTNQITFNTYLTIDTRSFLGKNNFWNF